MNLSNAWESVQKEVSDVIQWEDEEYDKYFGKYFKDEVNLYNHLKDTKLPIADDELEWILTSLPLELFSVSEQLSKLKTIQEVIKFHIKEVEQDYIKHADTSISLSKRKEDASLLTQEDKLLVTSYSNIAERVERQMTFSKELIMAAKKIWDARRSAEGPLPQLNSEQSELPEYEPHQKYIK